MASVNAVSVSVLRDKKAPTLAVAKLADLIEYPI